jgi:DNA-directed RNA polymerase subunit K/omega
MSTMDSSKVIPISETEKLLLEYDPAKNLSVPFMTRFEKTTILGVRLQQLCKGAPTVLSDDERAKLTTFEEMVDRELELRIIPLMVVRNMPNNEKELWKIEDLVIL